MCNPSGLNGFAGGNISFIKRLIPCNFETPNAFFLSDTRCLGYFTCVDTSLFNRPISNNFQCPRLLLGGNALGRQCFFARNLGGFNRLLGRDFGFLNRTGPNDFQITSPLIRANSLDINRRHLCDA